ncbi:alpha/beta hydrolase [Thalassotalea insulae]|uniref:Alpha/beta hydrolase n=1 Tax=Thalassotalea insulae TaxID=2056778 RepID=A0ABQ6GQW6_9GAMM|nr:alpha/beta hydrolase [Thalassotalea insulae]GLX77071.1 alpha/beta hydrolase [Thalassotalea insulae]
MSSTDRLREVSFDLRELTLSGLAKGDSNAPLVLCLHGWLDNAASFTPLMQTLNDYQLIALDWPGHGHSEHRGQDAHYHFIDYVYDLLLLFETQQWPAIDIVAHSMGGMIASAFAAAFPEKVKSLTLIDSIGFISAKAEQTTEQLRSGMLSRLKLKGKRKPVHPSLESAITARRQVSDLRYQDAKLIVERGLVEYLGGVTWRADSRLRNTSPYRLTLEQAKQFIKDIQAPVQLIYGDQGLVLVEYGLAEYGPLFQNFIAHQLPGGHHIHMEQAEKVSSLIQSFIENAVEV